MDRKEIIILSILTQGGYFLESVLLDLVGGWRRSKTSLLLRQMEQTGLVYSYITVYKQPAYRISSKGNNLISGVIQDIGSDTLDFSESVLI